MAQLTLFAVWFEFRKTLDSASPNARVVLIIHNQDESVSIRTLIFVHVGLFTLVVDVRPRPPPDGLSSSPHSLNHQSYHLRHRHPSGSRASHSPSLLPSPTSPHTQQANLQFFFQIHETATKQTLRRRRVCPHLKLRLRLQCHQAVSGPHHSSLRPHATPHNARRILLLTSAQMRTSRSGQARVSV